jgi:hypothetical protein
LIGWVIVSAVSVCFVAQLWMLYLMLRQVIAQLAVLTISVHDVHDQVTALTAELHAVDEALK